MAEHEGTLERGILGNWLRCESGPVISSTGGGAAEKTKTVDFRPLIDSARGDPSLLAITLAIMTPEDLERYVDSLSDSPNQ